MSRSYEVYWVVHVTIPGEDSARRFEFRGPAEEAEAEARECLRRAETAGMRARIGMVRPARSRLPSEASLLSS